MTTLVEELEEAADAIALLANAANTIGTEELRARLRLRAKAVRDARSEMADSTDDNAWWFLDRFDEAAGPDLASPPTGSPATAKETE